VSLTSANKHNEAGWQVVSYFISFQYIPMQTKMMSLKIFRDLERI